MCATIETKVSKVKTLLNEWNVIKGEYNHRIIDLEEEITQGLAKRLLAYANKRAVESGLFFIIEAKWKVSIYTLDGDDKPADRFYCVRYTNPTGCYIELVGILTEKGWPTLDHHFSIETNYI